MNISGLRPYAGFYEYNSIKAAELRTQQIAAVQMSSAGDALSENQAQPSQTYAGEEKSKQNFGALDYAQQYQPDATYDLKGKDSDLESLDVQKAISDMEKDQVLQQYQYFVETADPAVKKTNDTPVASQRSGENFSL